MFIPVVLNPRDLYSSPPPAQDIYINNPTLLVSWWCTCFSLVIIIARLCGRWIRTEKLFLEDKIMALSVIPLLARMGCVHVILRWGTNNALIEPGLSELEIWQREVGSKLVLPARIFYAAFLWIAKLTIAEFLRRMFSQKWKKSWEIVLNATRWFLILTFGGVIIATLAECRPFPQYWQVIPDPGPHCRQGITQLMVMGISDTITDIVLVAFPIHVVVTSNMRIQRKISLCLLFGLSLILVAITIYRMHATIEKHSNQQFRSLLASLEILAGAGVSNALVLGSFVRDRGAKKAKFKFGSTGGDSGLDRPATARTRTRSVLSWGSDIDLVADMGMRLGPELQQPKSKTARPAPVALPLNSVNGTSGQGSTGGDDIKTQVLEKDVHADVPAHYEEPPLLTPRRMSFFDVGGLLGDDQPRRPSVVSMNALSSTDSGSRLTSLSNGTAVRQRSPRGIRGRLGDMEGISESDKETRSGISMP